MSDCQSKFDYLDNGMILPACGDPAAKKTITTLNLDSFRLRLSRSAAIEAALEMRGLVSPSDWDAIYRNPPPINRPEFWPAIANQP